MAVKTLHFYNTEIIPQRSDANVNVIKGFMKI